MDSEKGSVYKIVKIRLTWLVIGLVTSLVLSKFIHTFEETLQQNILVVTFIPLIVYIADAIGTQMESVIIRTMSQKNSFDFTRFVKKQFSIVTFLGAILGVVGALGAFAIYKNLNVSLGLGVSIFITSLSALVTGTLIPYLFWKLHKDPAEASGPIATVIQDSLSIIVYFAVFYMILK